MILDAEFFAYLEAHAAELVAARPQTLVRVIARCCRLKADVVEQDEREETGLRAVLNYGHTFAHAFETLAGYGELLHGEAVASAWSAPPGWPSGWAASTPPLSPGSGPCSESLGLPMRLPKLDREKILAAMMHDKKVEHGRLRLVLPDRLGHVELVSDVSPEDVSEAMEA